MFSKNLTVFTCYNNNNMTCNKISKCAANTILFILTISCLFQCVLYYQIIWYHIIILNIPDVLRCKNINIIGRIISYMFNISNGKSFGINNT